MATQTTKSLYKLVVWGRRLRLLLDIVQYYAYFRLDSLDKCPRGGRPSSDDFTIISCTLGDESDYRLNVQSWLASSPSTLIIITTNEKVPTIRTLVDSMADHRIRLFSVEEANWRKQACEGIRQTSSAYLVFVDDDVTWSSRTLQHMCIAFADPAVGGVNTIQAVRPTGTRLTMWESLGALNLVRRNVLHSFLAYFNQGHILNLSGRTVGYRVAILQHEVFYTAFNNDYWRGRHRLRTGDDNFLTSWLVQRGWKTCFLNHDEALIVTTVNSDASYLRQLLRWSRDTARGYLRDFAFAMQERNSNLILNCALKTLANYTSDLAVILELGLLLITTALYGPDTDSSNSSLQS